MVVQLVLETVGKINEAERRPRWWQVVLALSDDLDSSFERDAKKILRCFLILFSHLFHDLECVDDIMLCK